MIDSVTGSPNRGPSLSRSSRSDRGRDARNRSAASQHSRSGGFSVSGLGADRLGASRHRTCRGADLRFDLIADRLVRAQELARVLAALA